MKLSQLNGKSQNVRLKFSDKINTDGVLLFFIIITSVKYTYSIETILDIRLFDETNYLLRGVHLLQWGIPDPSLSPLYSIWYYLLSLVESDRIQLYFLSYKILVTLTTVLVYLLLRGAKTNPNLAALASVVYLMSNVVFTHPYNTLFALLVILVFLNGAVRMSSEENFYFIVGAGILIMIFVRPEYLLSLILFVLWMPFYYLSIGSRFFRPTRLGKIAFFFLTAAILFYVFGNPLGGIKGWIAFGQHFSFRYVISYDLYDVDPWIGWANIMRTVFGDAHSISGAAMSNSSAFARHVVGNIGTFVLASFLLPFVTPFAFLPARFQSGLAFIQLSIFLGALLFLLRATLTKSVTLSHMLPKRLVVLALIIWPPNIIAALVFYPRWHYLIIQTVILLVCLFAFFSAATKNTIVHKNSGRSAFLIGLILFAIMPNHVHGWLPPIVTAVLKTRTEKDLIIRVGVSDLKREEQILKRRFDWTMPSWTMLVNYWSAQPFQLPQPQFNKWLPQRILENRTIIEFIRSIEIDEGVNMLSGGNYTAYLGDNYHFVDWRKKKESFSIYLNKEKINMILLTYLLKSDFAADEEFKFFLESFEEYGFVSFDVPGTMSSLLVKKSLL